MASKMPDTSTGVSKGQEFDPSNSMSLRRLARQKFGVSKEAF